MIQISWKEPSLQAPSVGGEGQIDDWKWSCWEWLRNLVRKKSKPPLLTNLTLKMRGNETEYSLGTKKLNMAWIKQLTFLFFEVDEVFDSRRYFRFCKFRSNNGQSKVELGTTVVTIADLKTKRKEKNLSHILWQNYIGYKLISSHKHEIKLKKTSYRCVFSDYSCSQYL